MAGFCRDGHIMPSFNSEITIRLGHLSVQFSESVGVSPT